MTDTSLSAPHQPLGVGKIISESFSLLFGNIVAVALAAFVPILFSLILSGMMLGFDVALGGGEPEDFLNGNIWWFMGLNMLISMVIYGIVTALIVQLAYDAKAGRGTNFKQYISVAIRTLVPNVIVTIIISILAGIGLMLLVVPGLWIYGVFAVAIPALVIEGVGFGAMTRSSELTKDYRWPVIGTLILVGIAAMILNLIPTFIVGVLTGALGGAGIFVSVIVAALLYTLTYGLVGISLSLIYARLREIKEGVSVDDLVAVFE